MRAIFAVFKRELALYFRSPIAYAIGFAVLFFLGMVFNGYISNANGQGPADSTLVLNWLTLLMVFIAPVITMRLIAEESREGTLETLMTLPMSEGQFIIGKFLAAWAYYTFLLLITLVHYFLLTIVGIPDQGATFTAYLGTWLFGGAVLAVALIWSAITEDQIVAALLSFATILVMYLAEIAASWLASQPNLASSAEFVRELGLQAHFYPTLGQGIIRAEDVVYYIFLIIGALFITTRIVETRRWRA